MIRLQFNYPIMYVLPLLTSIFLLSLAGCGSRAIVDEAGKPKSLGSVELVWGRRGNSDGRFQKPRAIAIDQQDRLYIVDMTARIQVFDRDGKFLRQWTTPTHENGRPVGLGVNQAGDILVADTHYNRLLIYSPEGELKQQFGGTIGTGPGEFGFVTDSVQDRHGNYFVGEYFHSDRIQKFDADGKFLLEWGRHGGEPGEFVRPQGLLLDDEDHVWVADACNHRIQVFDGSGKLLKIWGKQGTGLGELDYPYGIALDGQGHVYVAEFGNHRVQKFTLDGQSLGCFGHEGTKEGELNGPWGLVLDHSGALHILDSYNHRVQRVRF